MSTLTKSRRLPANYRVRPGGITEIVYNATPEVTVVLPGTRWLEQGREREARLAAAVQEAQAEITVHSLNLPGGFAAVQNLPEFSGGYFETVTSFFDEP